MTHIETSRVNELIGLNIGRVQEMANRLTATLELEQLEAGIADLEKAVNELKESLAALPYKRSLT